VLWGAKDVDMTVADDVISDPHDKPATAATTTTRTARTATTFLPMADRSR